MRLGPNELVFSEVFLLEHKQIIARLSGVTGISVEKINHMVRKRLKSQNISNDTSISAPMMQKAFSQTATSQNQSMSSASS